MKYGISFVRITNTMKMQKALLIGVLGLFTFPLLAETQTGYVRTIGRNGKPGKPISGVMVRAEGPANMVMSDANGQFALLLNDLGRDDAFKLTTVKKSNYELLDKDLIGRECGFTPVPMEIVLVNLSEMQAEKAAMAERFEQKYAETYQKKVAELQAQLDAQQITIDEAQKRQEELDQALEKMLSQIETLVDRYVRTDYDRLDSIDQQINAHIEMGEFDEAERLIRSKGSVEERLAALHESEDVQKQLEEAQRKLAVANEKKRESLKRDLNLLIDIADAHLRPDSAYFYRKQLVDIYPEDVDLITKLMYDARTFEEHDQAFMYFHQVDSIYSSMNHPDTLKWAEIYDLISCYLRDLDRTETMTPDSIPYLNYMIKKNNLLCSYYGDSSLECGKSKISLSFLTQHFSKDSILAKKLSDEAISIFQNLIAKDSNDLWAQFEYYTNYRIFYENVTQYSINLNLLYEKAILHPEQNDSLIKTILKLMGIQSIFFSTEETLRKSMNYYPQHLYSRQDSSEFARQINNTLLLGNIVHTDSDNTIVDSCCDYAIHLTKSIYPIDWYQLGEFYEVKRDYDSAIICFKKDMEHSIKVYGAENHRTFLIYHQIGDVYLLKGDEDMAMYYYKKQIMSSRNPGGLGHELNKVGRSYRDKGMYEKALDCFELSYQDAVMSPMYSKLGKLAVTTSKMNILTELMEIGKTYQLMGEKKKAKEKYNEVLRLSKEYGLKSYENESKAALAELKKK